MDIIYPCRQRRRRHLRESSVDADTSPVEKNRRCVIAVKTDKKLLTRFLRRTRRVMDGAAVKGRSRFFSRRGSPKGGTTHEWRGQRYTRNYCYNLKNKHFTVVAPVYLVFFVARFLRHVSISRRHLKCTSRGVGFV
jgi:hypothetical protein